jgi:hypothetical protein
MNPRTISVLALALLCVPAVAIGQVDRAASVGAGVSATNMDSHTDKSFSGSFGYRFSKVVGLEIEATLVPRLNSDFPGLTIQNTAAEQLAAYLQIYPSPSFSNPKGRAVIFSNNVRVTIPTTSTRLEPFFVAGGGIASIRREADYFYPFAVLPVPGQAFPSSRVPAFETRTQRLTSSTLGLALTLGGGVSVRATSSLWIDADLRLFRILGDTDQNVGRFGVGLRYRF